MSLARYARIAAISAALGVGMGAGATSAHIHVPSTLFNLSGSRHAHKALQTSLVLPQVSATIDKAIEIDGQNNGTNLYPFSSGAGTGYDAVNFPNDSLYTFLKLNTLVQTPTADTILNLEGGTPESIAVFDWVKDTLPNTDPASLVSGVATGILTNSLSEDPLTGDNAQTGTIYPGNPARGHWNGARIVDGISGDDHNIFVKGGKENQPDSWIVAPGSVGSSKYDITQAYLANTSYATTDSVNFPSGSKNVLFFGMERSGNNGTTAFDFEFDQKPPKTDYIPDRSAGDVLFTFEMNGSGSSGSAVPHIYKYNPDLYGPGQGGFDLSNDLASTDPPATAPRSSINQIPTPSAPWGYVNSKGQWTIGQIPNFSVCEAMAFFGPDQNILTNIGACGGKAYVQIRTRSSTTDTSDLKDTTKFFVYNFPGPVANKAFTTACTPTFTYAATGSHDSHGGTNLQYHWKFLPVQSGVTLTSTDAAFITDPDVTGGYKADFAADATRTVTVVFPVGDTRLYEDVKVSLDVQEATCHDAIGPFTVRVYAPANPLATKDSADQAGDAVNVSATYSGLDPSDGSSTVQWQVLKGSTWTNISGATSTSFKYNGFESDVTGTNTTFTIGTDTYVGKMFTAQLRMHVARFFNDGRNCTADSPAITVKKVIAADP